MRRIYLLLALTGSLMPATWTHAEAITPADARARAVDTEQVLVGLNSYLTEEYYHQGAFLESVRIYERIIELNPVGVEPYAAAAWLLWSSGKTPEAIAMYERMIAANPDDPAGFFEYGFYYTQHNADEKAAPLLKRAVELGLPAPQCHTYGHVLTRLGRKDEALAFWQQVLANNPNDAVAAREIGRLTGTAEGANAEPPTP